MTFSACFTCVKPNGDMCYAPIEFEGNYEMFPQNDIEDITALTKMANEHFYYQGEDIIAVDVYAVINRYGEMIWEAIG